MGRSQLIRLRLLQKRKVLSRRKAKRKAGEDEADVCETRGKTRRGRREYPPMSMGLA